MVASRSRTTSTSGDGMAPRTQVDVWLGKNNRGLQLQPSSGTPDYGVALFGPKNYDVTAQVVVGQDGQGSNVTDGCEPFTNNVDVGRRNGAAHAGGRVVGKKQSRAAAAAVERHA